MPGTGVERGNAGGTTVISLPFLVSSPSIFDTDEDEGSDTGGGEGRGTVRRDVSTVSTLSGTRIISIPTAFSVSSISITSPVQIASSVRTDGVTVSITKMFPLVSTSLSSIISSQSLS